METLNEEELRQLEAMSVQYCLSEHKKGNVQPRKKCCGKCAFRDGSPERSDPYGWMRSVEAWTQDKAPFFCHEGVPGHDQQEPGEALQICAGWQVMQGQKEEAWMDLAHCDGREPDPKFE
ncbi:MAG: hypothetical protein ACKVJE_17150 [Pseudomonadales bacterium]